MQLSDYVREKLKQYKPPVLFNFNHENNFVTDIIETKDVRGNILFFGEDRSEALKILAQNTAFLDWFILVDEDFNLEILGEPEEDLDIEKMFEQVYKAGRFEYRKEQIQMARLIYEAFETSKNAIIEAPTGTGKSLAYLVPAVVFSRKRGKRIVVSTNTKNLQQQLLKKDIPVLETVTDFRVAVAYGRNNYLCKRKVENLLSRGDAFLFESDMHSKLKEFMVSTETGLKSDFFSTEKGISDNFWSLVESNSLSCAHRSCPYYKSDCFFYRARKKLDHAQIIVANHHIVLSHSIMENAEILPEFGVLIIDEAHNLEKNATSYYTQTISSSDVLNVFDMLYSVKKSKEYGLLVNFDEEELKNNIFNTKLKLNEMFDQFMKSLKKEEIIVDERNLEEFFNFFNSLVGVLNGTQIVLKLFFSKLDETEAVDFKAIYNTLGVFVETFKSFEKVERKGDVYWIKKFKKTVHFNITPVSVRDALKMHLLDKLESTVFTSATLSVNGDFEFFKRLIGIDDAIEFIAKSNFDYEKNSRLFLVYDMPKPEDSGFIDAVSNVLLSLGNALRNTRKGVLTLFTSYKMLDSVYKKVSDNIESMGFFVFRQGELDNFEILNRFARGRGFLFATSSFWEGIDVKGEELSVVVIVKLPFEVPTTPIEKVRYDALKREGVNPFLEYSLPKAVIRLKQGLGRLIRQKDDRGVMIVLDSRITNMFYGKIFINSLEYMKQERVSKDEIQECISNFFDSFSD